MSEAQVQKDIIEYLRAHGCTVIRINSGIARHNIKLAPAGTPDLLVIDRLGQHWWVEVKGPNGKLREAQEQWIDEHRSRGVCVLVAHSLEDVYEIVD